MMSPLSPQLVTTAHSGFCYTFLSSHMEPGLEVRLLLYLEVTIRKLLDGLA
jgi:hypothetical protein